MKKSFLLLFFFLFYTASNCFAQPLVGFLIPVSGLGDQSFNDMTYAGLIQAKNLYKFDIIRENCDGPGVESHRRAMQKLIERKASVIVANGWEFNQVITEYAKTYPDLRFVINDSPLPGLANVISTVFGQHEGSFLAGALAAWTTKSGRIGFIGGKDMPVIRAFLTGFREGAIYARDDIQIDEVFLSAKDEESSGFDNPALAYTEADGLYDRDVDIIFSVAGLSGNGIIRAAVENEKFVIGVDADQDHMAKGHILTSMMKRLDRATVEALRRIIEGDFSPGILYFGLREDGVALSPMTYTHDMFPPEILEKINSLKTRIIAGEIVVTNYLEKNS